MLTNGNTELTNLNEFFIPLTQSKNLRLQGSRLLLRLGSSAFGSLSPAIRLGVGFLFLTECRGVVKYRSSSSLVKSSLRVPGQGFRSPR